MLYYLAARRCEIPFNEAAFLSIMLLFALQLTDISNSLESIRKKVR